MVDNIKMAIPKSIFPYLSTIGTVGRKNFKLLPRSSLVGNRTVGFETTDLEPWSSGYGRRPTSKRSWV